MHKQAYQAISLLTHGLGTVVKNTHSFKLLVEMVLYYFFRWYICHFRSCYNACVIPLGFMRKQNAAIVYSIGISTET